MAVPGKRASEKGSLPPATVSSDEDLQIYCQPCDDEGQRLTAHGYCENCQEHLCKTCFTVHKKHKLSKHHTLLDASKMPKALQQPTSSFQTSLPDELTTPCTKHPKETIKFYCNDHEELLCSVCVTLEHQSTSCKVNYIPDISGDIIDSVEYQVILHAVNSLVNQYKKIEEDVKTLTSTSNSSIQNVLADIKNYRQEINKRLDALERQAEAAAKVITQSNNDNLMTVETTCEDITKSLNISSYFIEKLNTLKQADKLFMELKLLEQKMKDVEKNTLQLNSCDVKEHLFKPNEAILSVLKTEKSFGNLIQNSIDKKSTQSVKTELRKITRKGEICVKNDNEYRCWITGMTLLTPDLLIITDYQNDVIKMVDNRMYSVTGSLKVEDGPWDITTVTSTELAVTLPFKETIQFISISSNKLTKKRTMKVDGKCLGISCHQDKLVVSFSDPAKLQILDMNGTILREINGENVFKSPYFVKTNSNYIYISDQEMRSVTRFNWQGEVIGSYGYLVAPGGITLSDDGTVFVCDNGRNVIEEISGDCSTGKVLLKNLKSPYALCWCADTKKIYNSIDSEDEKSGNFLQIHQLS